MRKLACVCGLLLTACLPKGEGLRDAVPGDRSGKLEGSYTCQEPSAMRMSSGAIVQAPAKESIALYNGPSGLVLLDDENHAITNHWQSPEGDRFYVSYSSIARETLVPSSRALAIQRGFEESQTQPDGSQRPKGIPLSIETCIPTSEYTVRKNSQLPGLGASNVVSMAYDEVKPTRRLSVSSCHETGRANANIDASFESSKTTFFWMPDRIFLAADGPELLFVAFGRPRLANDEVLWKLKTENDAGHDTAFSLGAIKYLVKVGPDSKRPGKLLGYVFGIESTTKTNLECDYAEQ